MLVGMVFISGGQPRRSLKHTDNTGIIDTREKHPHDELQTSNQTSQNLMQLLDQDSPH